MNLIGTTSPWTDAANYGAGLGQSLGQALVQRPFERLQLAQGLAQFQQAQQLKQAMLGLQQQRANDMNQYRMGLVGNGDMRNQLAGLALQLKMMQAGQPKIEDGFFVPGFNTGDTNTIPAPAPTAQTGGAGTGQATGQGLSNVPQQQATALPGGIQQLPARQQTPNPNAQQRNMIDLTKLYMSGLADTNTPSMFQKSPGLQQLLSNQVYGAFSPQAVQQPQQGLQNTNQLMPQAMNMNDGMDTNAILQQAQQAIQAGANPAAVRQRLQQMGLGQ